ncbi:MAG: PKD domain-containing protein [Chitinophagaceae bacterium]
MYTAPGQYLVCLTRYLSQVGSTNVISCTYCDSVYITQVGGCNLNAGFVPSVSGLTASFTNNTTCSGCATGINYSWDFGDGNSSTAASPTHTYANPGVYTVCVLATSTGSNPTSICVDSACATITVGNSTTGCGANVNFSQTAAGLNVLFSNSSTPSTPTSVITSYSWDFGDASPISNAVNPTHSYTSAGAYTVCLTAYSVDTLTSLTCVDSSCHTVTVSSGTLPCNLTASFTPTTLNGSVYTFTNNTTCTGCSSTLYAWNFGDGATANNVSSPSHTYTANGTYNVCLVAIGNINSASPCFDTTCQQITVILSGINDVSTQKLNIYPNPTQNELHILLPQSVKPSLVSIIDPAGRVVLQQDIKETTQSKEVLLNTDALSKGLYYIKMKTNQGTMMSSIIKE